jgi:hypothetical protein
MNDSVPDQALQEGQPQDRHGNCYALLCRLHPYSTSHKRIAGIIA